MTIIQIYQIQNKLTWLQVVGQSVLFSLTC